MYGSSSFIPLCDAHLRYSNFVFFENLLSCGIIAFFSSSVKGTILECIVSSIMRDISFYTFFYMLQDQANPVSLLLFWLVLWSMSFSIYFIIENWEEVIESETLRHSFPTTYTTGYSDVSNNMYGFSRGYERIYTY